jgi:arylsulfatase A-like enzyme
MNQQCVRPEKSKKEAMMKSLKIAILCLGVLTLAFGSQQAAAQESGDGNAIPYPNTMLDDAGYSSASSYGGIMKTPTFDRIGREGLRYTHMSVAAVCSPTRGSLLTGYNIHQIGTGIISEFATGYPGYNSQMDYSTPSIAKILTENGYATAAFGKWHNTPMEEASPAGPFESWPTGLWGFEYFWGFLGGETNQFHPLLI